MKNKHRLFAAIESILPPHVKLANEVSELLSINVNAAYDRIAGRVPLKLEEAEILCRHYRISLDAVLGLSSDTIAVNYVPLALGDPQQYMRYILGLKASMERLAAGEKKQLLFAADDIPIFHFMPFPELTFFKLYAWNRTMNEVEADGSYEQFFRTWDRPELRDVFRKITVAYLHVPTVEIWTEETIQPLLRLLAHYRKMGKFEQPETLGKLCGQLLSLVESLEDWANMATKGSDSDVPYTMFLCPVQPGSGMMLAQCDGNRSARIKLYTINSIATDDERFCDETQQWLVQTISKSTNLSGASEVKRMRFFDAMKEKVRALTA